MPRLPGITADRALERTHPLSITTHMDSPAEDFAAADDETAWMAEVMTALERVSDKLLSKSRPPYRGDHSHISNS